MACIAVFLFLSFLLKSAKTDDCGPNFNHKCSCGVRSYDRAVQYVVDCTNENFSDTGVLKYLPEQTQVLIFTGNNVHELPWNIFGDSELKNLTVIDMSNNKIQNIRGKTFHKVASVKRLILNHNNISISPDDAPINLLHPRVFSNFINLQELHLTNAFAENSLEYEFDYLHSILANSNLTKLMKLHLEQNEISKFNDRKVFCDLISLQDLHLGDNYLKSIDFNVFCIKKLRFLDLERNRIEYLKTKELYNLDQLANGPNRETDLTLDLNANPFTCDCEIEPFKDWLQKTNVSVRNAESLECVKRQKRQYVLSLPVRKCKTSTHSKSTANRATLIFVLIVLSFTLLGFIVALIYVSKDRIKRVVNPALNRVTKKVQYTTIKDDDTPEQYV